MGFSGIAEDRALVLARTRAGRTHGLKLRLVGAEYRALAPGPSGTVRARGLQLRLVGAEVPRAEGATPEGIPPEEADGEVEEPEPGV